MRYRNEKAKVGKYLVPMQVGEDEETLFFKFGYNKGLIELIKERLERRRWNPDERCWTAPRTSRNLFVLEHILNRNPYRQWDKALEQYPIPANHLEDENMLPWEHQIELYNQCLTRKQTVIVGDMGTGKSRVVLMGIEYLAQNWDLKDGECWFIGPVNAVNSIQREIRKWGCPVKINIMTYEKAVRHAQSYAGRAPRVLILDEASRLKNWGTQRTKAANHIAEAMRNEYGNDCYIWELSGTPAPKAPTDWWSLAEIARPGFLREGNVAQLRNNLCLIEQREGAAGLYPHIITWFDNDGKCVSCGKLKDEHFESDMEHLYKPSENMLEKLYRRLKGLVVIKLIDDCLDLPETTLHIVRVKPHIDTIRAADLIKNSSHRAPQKLILLRELSDGFQYKDVEDGFVECPRCHGTKVVDEVQTAQEVGYQESMMPVFGEVSDEVTCPYCEGEGVVPSFRTEPEYVDTPKDAFVNYLLQEYEEYGRFIFWVSFTAAIDRVTKLCLAQGWVVLQIDGRGLIVHTPDPEIQMSVETALDCMDYSHKHHNDLLREHPKVVVVSHPSSGGMAYTFTAAPADCYYDNDFNVESKIQSEARKRRGGMCTTRKCHQYELIHIPTDLMVLQRLNEKRSLQAITLADLKDYTIDGVAMEYFDGEKFID